MLQKGPVLLNPITSVLLSSRMAPYVLSSDIAKVFLQPAKGDNLVIYCFDRVIFGLRPSPVLPAVVIEKHTKR
ncbi:hypothetical protein AAVH_26437 [Aphelenchoides avenae]|nr:hypothetical protein AAVH_26437 [Aphelenchus avenae]